ncbi:MAG: 30S ribosomal protein S8 [bacterium]
MDAIADLLTRVRNGIHRRHRDVRMPFSRVKHELARILLEEGYVNNFQVEGEGIHRSIVVTLKYNEDGSSVIKGLRRISRQSRRVYVGADGLPKVLGGLGVAVVTTSRGMLTDRDARREGVGGEVICEVW